MGRFAFGVIPMVDKKAIRKYKARRDGRLKKRGFRLRGRGAIDGQEEREDGV